MRSITVSVFLLSCSPHLHECPSESHRSTSLTLLSPPFFLPGSRSRLYKSTGFFFLAWATHYLPFYVMGRQLFLHHYLPAHLASCLVTGALVEFIFSADAPEPSAPRAGPKKQKRFVTARERFEGQSIAGAWIAMAVVLALAALGWYFFLPLTYGFPGLTVEQVLRRKWLGYDLHFAK